MWSTLAQQPDRLESSRLARNRGRRFAWSVAAGVLGRAATPLLSIVITPYALAKLGPERFGLFALALMISGWLALLDPGLAPGLRIVLARRSNQLDARTLGPLMAAAKAGQRLLAAAMLVAGCALAFVAPDVLAIPQELHGEARTLFLLVAAGAAAGALGRHYAAALDACQWSSVERVVRLGQAVLRAALLGLLLALGVGLAAAGWSFLVACLAGVSVLGVACRRLLPEIEPKPCGGRAQTKRRRAALGELIRPGAWLSLGAVAGVLVAGVDRAVVARAVSLQGVTVFALTGAAFLLAEAMVTSILDAARPMLAQAAGGGELREAARLYKTLAETAAAGGIFAANRAFVGAWAGPELYGGWRLDAWFALALIVNLWSLPHRALLAADLRAREATLWRLAEGALNLALSVALAMRFGLAGVAAGTALAAVFTSWWALPLLAARAAGLSPRAALRPAAAGLALLALSAPVASLARQAAGEAGFLSAALAAGAAAVPAAALWWRIGLPTQLRMLLPARLRPRRRIWSEAV
jgi:O-antigen/teichoic acid export membrane protein